VAHRDERLELEPDDVGAALEGVGAADELAKVYVNRGVDRRATEREVAELDGAKLPELLREPEVFGGWFVAQGKGLPGGVMEWGAVPVVRDGAGGVKRNGG